MHAGGDEEHDQVMFKQVHSNHQWKVSWANSLCKGRRYCQCQSQQQYSVQRHHSLVIN